MVNDPTQFTGSAARADGCDESTLVAFVAGALAPAAERKLETHLERCETCRARLDRLAGSEAEWTTVRALLADDGDEPSCAPFDPDRDGDDTALAAALVRTILPCLAPTDDERMLGRLGPYEIAGIVGSGGMGIVLKGHDRSLDRFVAIKVLKPHLATSGAARKRFLREARAAAGIVHDNVIAIHGVGEADGLPYLVMPYCRGTTLAKRVRDRGPLDLREILRIGMQTARGLAAAHAQGLVHRDVKPANILLDDGVDRVLLTDFGLARAADDASLTVTGLLAGTPHYMSPEQALGLPIDARSDLFALGAMLFTMATGKPPFRAESSHAVLRQVTDTEPADIRRDNADMPGWFAALVRRLLAKDPAARFQSAADVAGILEACLAHVNDPLANPLPAEVAVPATSHRLLPHDQLRNTRSTFLALLRRIMSDQRILAITALMLLLAALLLPWPIAAMGRDEFSMLSAAVFAAVAAGTSLLFGWLARGDSLGRLVLRMAGIATVVGGLLAGVFLVQSNVNHARQRVAIIADQNNQLQAVMERQATDFAQGPRVVPVPPQMTMPGVAPQNPVLIPNHSGPRVAPGPDPMPVVGWPAGNAPSSMPVVTTPSGTVRIAPPIASTEPAPAAPPAEAPVPPTSSTPLPLLPSTVPQPAVLSEAPVLADPLHAPTALPLDLSPVAPSGAPAAAPTSGVTLPAGTVLPAPVLADTVTPAPVLADALAAAPVLADVPAQAPRSTATLAPAPVPTPLPAEAPTSVAPVAAGTGLPVPSNPLSASAGLPLQPSITPPAAEPPSAEITKRLVEEVVSRLEETERALAIGGYVAIADVEIRARNGLPSATTVMPVTDRGRIEVTVDEPFDLPIPGLMETTTLQEEATTRFLGRSVTSIITDLGLHSRDGRAGDRVVLTTESEPGDGFEQIFEFKYDRSKGMIVTKSRDVRFRRSDPFRCMNLTKADDFREVAPGIWFPHRISIDYHDLKEDTPADAIPPLACSIRITIVEWKPTEDSDHEDEDPRDPAEEGDDDEPLEAAEDPESDTEDGMEEDEAPEESDQEEGEEDGESAEASEDPASESEDASNEDEESPEPGEDDAVEAPEDPEAPESEPAEESTGEEDAPDESGAEEPEAILPDDDPFKV